MTNAPRTKESFRLPTSQAVRIVARSHLQRALGKAARLVAEAAAMSEPPAADPHAADPEAADPEAVHDFRVALRRLRSWLRAFQPFLNDTVKASAGRRLRRIARVAGRARDLEVQSHWLQTLPPAAPRLALDAAHWLIARNAEEYADARRKLANDINDDLPKLASKLGNQLRHYLLDINVDAPERERSLGEVMAQLLREHRARVTASLAKVKTGDQRAAVHAARIAVKRLRYLLESLDDISRSARTHGRRLALLQNVFGELHDAQVLSARIAGELVTLGGRVVRRHGATDSDSSGEPSRRAWLALQRQLGFRVNAQAGRALRAAHSRATERSLAAIDAVARSLESRQEKFFFSKHE